MMKAATVLPDSITLTPTQDDIDNAIRNQKDPNFAISCGCIVAECFKRTFPKAGDPKVGSNVIYTERGGSRLSNYYTTRTHNDTVNMCSYTGMFSRHFENAVPGRTFTLYRMVA